MKINLVRLWSCAILVSAMPPAQSADLYQPTAHTAYAADRRAAQAGDVVTVIVVENSTASNTADTSTNANFGVRADVSGNWAGQHQLRAGVGDDYSGKGRLQRTGRLVAQVTASVMEVLANGDLLVAGSQAIDINGEKTNIKLRGRVRAVDIAENNTVLSSRLADAKIDYIGDGFLTDRARPGLIPRFFGWLGLW